MQQDRSMETVTFDHAGSSNLKAAVVEKVSYKPLYRLLFSTSHTSRTFMLIADIRDWCRRKCVHLLGHDTDHNFRF